MANKVITRTIIEPTNPAGTPGEGFTVQRPSIGPLQVIYHYDGHEQVLDVPPGSQTETRLLQLLATVRNRVWT